MNRSLLRLPKILFPTVLLALSLSPIAVDADEGPILDEATALAQCAATIPAPTITILPAPGVDADDSVDGAMECVDNFDPCTSTTLPVCIEDTLCQLGHDIDEGLVPPRPSPGDPDDPNYYGCISDPSTCTDSNNGLPGVSGLGGFGNATFGFNDCLPGGLICPLGPGVLTLTVGVDGVECATISDCGSGGGIPPLPNPGAIVTTSGGSNNFCSTLNWCPGFIFLFIPSMVIIVNGTPICPVVGPCPGGTNPAYLPGTQQITGVGSGPIQAGCIGPSVGGCILPYTGGVWFRYSWNGMSDGIGICLQDCPTHTPGYTGTSVQLVTGAGTPSPVGPPLNGCATTTNCTPAGQQAHVANPVGSGDVHTPCVGPCPAPSVGVVAPPTASACLTVTPCGTVGATVAGTVTPAPGPVGPVSACVDPCPLPQVGVIVNGSPLCAEPCPGAPMSVGVLINGAGPCIAMPFCSNPTTWLTPGAMVGTTWPIYNCQPLPPLPIVGPCGPPILVGQGVTWGGTTIVCL